MAWQTPVRPGGLHVCPLVPLLFDAADADFDPLDVAVFPPLAPSRPGILKGMHSEGRSLVESKSVSDHLGLLASSPRLASMEREREMSALFVSSTPVLDAPAVLEQRPAESLRYNVVSEIKTLLLGRWH